MRRRCSPKPRELVLRREKDRRDAGKRAPHDLPLREVTSELGAAMRLSDRAVQERISTASTLLDSFPATFVSLRDGRIDLAHATADHRRRRGFG